MDHNSHEAVATRSIINDWLERLEAQTERDLSGVERILGELTGADRQLMVWHETGSVEDVARDVVARTRAMTEG